MDGCIFNVLGKYAPVCPDGGRSVAQDALDHDQVAAGLHRAAGLYHAVYMDVSHGLDSEAAEHVAVDIDVAKKGDAPRGKVHVPRDIHHRLDVEAAACELHMARNRGQQRDAVLTDLRIPPRRQRHGFAAFGGDLLVQHCPARLALGGPDQMADLLPLLYIADLVQGRVVHLPELVYLQHPLDHPGEIIHNIAVFPIEGGFPAGNQEQVEIPPLVPAHMVHHLCVYAVVDLLVYQGLVEHLPGDLLARPHRRENDYPGVELICGEEEVGERVQRGQLRCLLFFSLLLAILALAVSFLLVPVVDLLQPRLTDAGQDCFQPFLLLFHQLHGENPVFI